MTSFLGPESSRKDSTGTFDASNELNSSDEARRCSSSRQTFNLLLNDTLCFRQVWNAFEINSEKSEKKAVVTGNEPGLDEPTTTARCIQRE